MISIRKMQSNDASAVAEVHTKSWQFAYRGIVDQKFLESMDPKRRAERWKETILNDSSGTVRLVAEFGGDIIGLALGLENRSWQLLPSSDCELNAIYVHPDHIGKGVGAELLRRFRQEMRLRSKKRLCIWALQENRRAREFYEKQGGVLSPVVKEVKIGERVLSEVAYEFEIK